MSDEFENRENGLGELPEDLARMRDFELPFLRRQTKGTPGGIPTDVIGQSRSGGLPGEAGSVPMPVRVNTVFDALPINARDFYNQNEEKFQYEDDVGEVLGVTTVNHSMTVPGGFIGLLRGFKYELHNPIVFATTVPSALIPQVKTTLFLNGSPIPDYQDLSLKNGGEIIKCYVPAEIGAVIKIETTFSLLGISEGSTIDQTIIYSFFGQFLLSHGLPANFEPGSHI